MKKKSILLLTAAALIACAGTICFTACDEKSTAPSVEDSNVREINIADELRDAGVRVDRVLVAKGKPVATIYARFQKLFSMTVILKAFDKTGHEIGRAKRVLTGDVDDATYSDFEFDARVPMKSASYFSLVRATTETVPAGNPSLLIEENQPDILPETDVPAEKTSATPPPETLENNK